MLSSSTRRVLVQTVARKPRYPARYLEHSSTAPRTRPNPPPPARSLARSLTSGHRPPVGVAIAARTSSSPHIVSSIRCLSPAYRQATHARKHSTQSHDSLGRVPDHPSRRQIGNRAAESNSVHPSSSLSAGPPRRSSHQRPHDPCTGWSLPGPN